MMSIGNTCTSVKSEVRGFEGYHVGKHHASVTVEADRNGVMVSASLSPPADIFDMLGGVEIKKLTWDEVESNPHAIDFAARDLVKLVLTNNLQLKGSGTKCIPGEEY